MSVLDENLKPAVYYTDIYEHGSVYIPELTLEINRGTEIPYVRDVELHQNCESLTLPIQAIDINDCPVESMIAEGLNSLFCTDAIYVHAATPTRFYTPRDYETYVAILGDGHFRDKQIQTCKIVLKRNHCPTKSSHST